MRNTDTADRGEQARAYLAKAKASTDRLNRAAAERGLDRLTLDEHQRLATTNALLAIAMVQVPDEPGMRLA